MICFYRTVKAKTSALFIFKSGVAAFSERVSDGAVIGGGLLGEGQGGTVMDGGLLGEGQRGTVMDVGLLGEGSRVKNQRNSSWDGSRIGGE